MSSANQYLDERQLKEMAARSDWKGIGLTAHAWGVIFGSMALFAAFPNPLTYIVAVMLIGARQLGLAVLMHDGSHGILCKTPWINGFVSQWFCAFPVFSDSWPYRDYHLKHHRYTQQQEDPDLSLSAPFPITRESLRRKVIRDLTGQTAFKQRRSQLRAALGSSKMTYRQREQLFISKLGGAIFMNLLLLVILTVAGKPHYFLTLWLVPFVTWHQMIIRIRNIAEHAVVPDDYDISRNARTTLANPLIRAVLAPYYVNYHVEHHMIMYIPCYNLPRMHELLRQNGWHEQMEIQPDYLTVLRMATSAGEDDNEPGHQTPTDRVGIMPSSDAA